MRLDEIFSESKPLTEIPVSKFREMVLGGSHVTKAWGFDVQGQPYAAFVEEGDAGDEDKFAFAALVPAREGSGKTYKLAWGTFSSKQPFMVLGNVMGALMAYLKSPDAANVVTFIGSTSRQDQFYLKALTTLAKRLPEYAFLTDNSEFLITKDQDTAALLLGDNFYRL